MDNKINNSQKKGPIRFEAIIPVAVIVVLIGLYSHFFFDNHLRKGLEWTGSYIHGAEVDVENLKLSVFGGFLEVKGIQVTNKENPKQNLLSVGKIRFEILWDALLRLKFVVNDASVEKISIYSDRKKAGWVRPPAKTPEGQSEIEKIEKNALNQMEGQFTDNILGDLAQLAGGTDDKQLIADIKDQLLSEKKIAEIKNLTEQKKVEWKDRIDSLPNKKEFDAISQQAKGLKFNTKDPKGFAQDLKDLSRLLKEADTQMDKIKETSKLANQDLNFLNKEVKGIDDLIKQDIADLEKRMKLPKLDGASFSKSLFMKMLGEKLAPYQKYITVAQQYMPPPKDPSEKAPEPIVPRKRGEGITYRFPVTWGYPAFWVKKTLISSQSSDSGFSGDLEGELLNITNNQALINKPTTATLKGAFPQQSISGILAAASFDHRKSPSKQEISAQVGAYPINNMNLQNSSDVKLLMQKAVGQLSMEGQFIGGNINLNLKNNFQKPSFELDAKSKIIQEILRSVLDRIETVTVDARVVGTWSKLKIDIDSNLGHELGLGFNLFFKKKMDEMHNQLQTQVNDRVNGELKKLNAELDKLKGGLTQSLKGRQDEIDKLKNQVQQSSNKSSDSKSKAKEDLKKKGMDLLKKLKF